MQPNAEMRRLETDVLVVGAGPSGLAAATELKRQGVSKVIAIERSTVAGGIPRYCGHSPFGMREFHRILAGPAYADRLIDSADKAGVDIRTGHTAVAFGENDSIVVTSSAGMLDIRAKRVILATGTRETTRAAALVSGDRPIGIMNSNALQLYAYREGLRPFYRPVIVGSELVSMSAILTCRSVGAKVVALAEERPAPLLRRPFSLFPNLLGIPVHYGTRIDNILGKTRVEGVRLRNSDGETRDIACDSVVFTGRFTPEASLARMLGLAISVETGGPLVDDFGRTSLPWIFAAGNVLHPVETAGWSWAEGARIGRGVARDLVDPDPLADDTVAVTAADGVKYAMPQRFHRSPGRSLPNLQIRILEPFVGMLVVEADGQHLWSKPLRSGPERRILIPIDKIRLPASVRSISVKLAKAG